MKRPPKWLLVATGFALVPVGILLDAHRRAAAVVRAAEDRLAVLASAGASKDRSRPVLEGEAVDRNAWDVYARLYDAAGRPVGNVGEVPLDEGEILPQPGGPADDAEWERMGRLLAEALRCSRADPGFRPDSDLKEMSGVFVEVSICLRSCGLRLEALAGRGRSEQVVEQLPLMLAALQDVGRGGMVMHHGCMVDSELTLLRGMRRLLRRSAWSAPVLERLARRLDAVDPLRPSVLEALEVEEVHLRWALLYEPGDVEEGPGVGDLFSETIRRARACRGLEEGLAEVRRAARLPAMELRPALKAAEARTDASGNARLRSVLLTEKKQTPNPFSIVADDRVARLWRLLLRTSVAVAWHQAETGRFPEHLDVLVPRYLGASPVCPVSGLPLRCAPGKIWSVGVDGQDDGGLPDSAKVDGGALDVVWFVK